MDLSKALNAGRRFGLASLSGCLWFLSCTPYDLSALAWLAMVPALYAILDAPRLRDAALAGWWAGAVATGGGFHWLIQLMHRFAGLPWLAAAAIFLLFCAYQGIVFLLFALLLRQIRSRSKLPVTLLAPILMVACEFVVPVLFPFGLWITQAWHPLLIQIAELTGPRGVTALLLLVNGALYELLTRGRAAYRPALAAALLMLAVIAGGALRMRQIDAEIAAAPRLNVGLVQPNFSYTSGGRISRAEALRQLRELQAQSARLERAGANLIVWSESSYPSDLNRDQSADFPVNAAPMIRRDIGVPLLAGAVTRDPLSGKPYNSAILIVRDGTFAGRYDKVRLLAFGEYVPGIENFPWLRKLMPEGIGNFEAGDGPVPLILDGGAGRHWILGPVICYEDILPSYLRRVGALHPDLLVNMTSDAWFGADAEPWEHLALTVFASVELRVSTVRAVDTGISAVIDPNGRLLKRSYAIDPYLEFHPADGIVAAVPLLSGGRTLFVAAGNWFALLCLGFAGLCCVAAYRGSPARDYAATRGRGAAPS